MTTHTICFDEMLRTGEVESYADLARIGHVSRARISQIMGLLDLAPSIQEAILSLPSVTGGTDRFTERQLRPLPRMGDWDEQARCWQAL